MDLEGVRLYPEKGASRRLGARAFAASRDIGIAPSEWRPETTEVGAFYWTVLAPDIVNPGREERVSIQL